jgi:hypothetical protein
VCAHEASGEQNRLLAPGRDDEELTKLGSIKSRAQGSLKRAHGVFDFQKRGYLILCMVAAIVRIVNETQKGKVVGG